MSESVFRVSIVTVALIFTGLFFVLVIPALIEDPDIVGAFAAGFVNPYSSGYASDAIACWVILAIWIIHETKTVPKKIGALCLAVGVIPGVAVGFGAYLLLRSSWLDEA
jgi:hypothetical protein